MIALGVVLMLILVFIFTLWRVYEADAMGPASDVEEEQMATFDEEEATFDSEPMAAVSSLLHGVHYHPPGYFSDRVKRSLRTHPLMHVIPFAVLVMLSFVTTRYRSKRKTKRSWRNRPVFEKMVDIGAWMFLVTLFGLISVGVSDALVYSPVKDAVVSFLGEGQKIYQTQIEITPDAKQNLKSRLDWEPQESSIKVYYSKTQAGIPEAYAFVLSDRLALCGGLHKFCIKVSSSGEVEEVKILELTCDRSYAINTRAFLNQFKQFTHENADHIDCSVVSGATLSTELTRNVVCRALMLFDLLEGSKNA
jgi:hypothetical protein